MKYLDMITDAIITLGERSGSSRQALWKCIEAKYPEADYKQFLIRLKKEAQEGNLVANKQKFKLDPKVKAKMLKGKGTGSKKSQATMKSTTKRRGASSKAGGSKRG
jgi:hypothetical protein